LIILEKQGSAEGRFLFYQKQGSVKDRFLSGKF